MLDLYGKCPALDTIFEKVLTDPTSSGILQILAGNIKLRGYNIQRFTGAYDPPPAIGPAPMNHEWHRDARGEINIAIMLTDCEKPENGATALIKGTHKFPYCPRKNCLFGPPYNFGKGLSFFLKNNFFNRLLAKKTLKNATGAYGKKGDVYIFLNDTWHGRQPNLHGNKGMRLMIGCFPNDIPYPDIVKPVSGEILNTLPPTFQKVLRPQPLNTGNRTLMDKIILSQTPPKLLSLFYWARLERKFADLISLEVKLFYSFYTKNMQRVKSKSVRLLSKAAQKKG